MFKRNLRKRKSLHSIWREYLDKLWSIVVHARDKENCQLCGKQYGRMNAHHIFEKAHDRYGRAGLRWDIDNGILLCWGFRGCHTTIHGDPELHAELTKIAKKRIGEQKYEKLRLASKIATKGGKIDYRAWELLLIQELNQMEITAPIRPKGL